MKESQIIKVVIADDELPIREELKLIDWKSYNAVLVGVASDGCEAMDLCQEYKPDLLIADISMPVMDGMELILVVKKFLPHIQIALLTCHTSFEYAQQAIKFSIIEYIVKGTMTEDDICRVVCKARNNIEQEKMASLYSNDAKRFKQTKYLNTILKNPDATSFSEDILFPLSFPFRFVRLCVIFQSKDWIFVNKEFQDCLITTSLFWFPIEMGEYLIFSENNNISTFKVKILSLIKKLEENFGERLSYIRSRVRIYALISDIVNNESEFKIAYNTLETWKCHQFYEFERKLFTGTPPAIYSINIERWKQFKNIIIKSAASEENPAEAVRNDFSKWAFKARVIPEELKSSAVELVTELSQNMFVQLKLRDIEQKIFACKDIDDLTSVIVYLLDNASGNKAKSKAPIRAAKIYIQSNLAEPLNLVAVADKVGLSSSYFSRIFAEQTGETFNEYVTRQRMEKAIYLLKNSNEKIYQIANNVGIPNYRYFSSLFKNWTGVTPKEYRNDVAT